MASCAVSAPCARAAEQKIRLAKATDFRNFRLASTPMEGKNKELAMSSVSLPGSAQGIFRNAKFSHMRLNLGNDPRHAVVSEFAAHCYNSCIMLKCLAIPAIA